MNHAIHYHILGFNLLNLTPLLVILPLEWINSFLSSTYTTILANGKNYQGPVDFPNNFFQVKLISSDFPISKRHKISEKQNHNKVIWKSKASMVKWRCSLRKWPGVNPIQDILSFIFCLCVTPIEIVVIVYDRNWSNA